MMPISLEKDLKNRKVLVTGAGGLVGGAVCNLLYQKAIPFIALYRTEPLTAQLWDYYIGDLKTDQLAELLTGVNIGSIIHCAALIPNENHSFAECFEVNTAIDKEIAAYASQYFIQRLIFLSTTNIYERGDHIIDENSALSLDNLYGKAKASTEVLFSSIPTTTTISLRINAPYHYTQKNTTVLKLFINSILENKDIFYHGTGRRQQNFTHVFDIARAVVSSLASGEAGVYNIAGSSPVSMKELAELILSKIPGSKSKISPSGLSDSQENQKASFDLSKAKTALKWEPVVSLDEGITEWIKYLKQ